MKEISLASIRLATLKTVFLGLCIAILMTLGFTGGSWYLIAISIPGAIVLLQLAWFASARIFYFFWNKNLPVYFCSFFLGFLLLVFSISAGVILSSIAMLNLYKIPLASLGAFYLIFTYGSIPLAVLALLHSWFLTREFGGLRQETVKHFFFLAFAILATFLSLWFVYYYLNRAIPEKVVIPYEFEGEFVILFDQPVGEKEQIVDGTKIYKIPFNGVLITQAKESEGLDPSRTFLTNNARDELVPVGKSDKQVENLVYDGYLDSFANNCSLRYSSYYFGSSPKLFQKSYVKNQKIVKYLKAIGYVCRNGRLYLAGDK
ncbi:MAG: hypothetical protein AAF518_17435 [Spirochaetota bacterium]